MIAPEGYRPVLELHSMAIEVAEDISDENDLKKIERMSLAIEQIRFAEGSPEHTEESVKIYNGWHRSRDIAANTMVDRFLERQPRLYIASQDGRILEISKVIVLPDKPFYPDLDYYYLYRDREYECVDTSLWVIDHQKFIKKKEVSEHFRDTVTEFHPNLAAHITEHGRYAEYLKGFDCWSLCISEAEFPKSQNILRGIWQDKPPSSSGGSRIYKRILELAKNPKLTKSQIRQVFPDLSFRQFEHHWKIAAEKNPELSKPGRKS